MKQFFSSAVALALCAAVACSRDPETVKRKYIESGDRYFKAGKFDAAAIEYANAVARDTQFAEGRLKLADAYMATGNTRAAFPEYMRAADLMPDNVELQLRAGTLLLKGGLFEEAKNRARAVLQKDQSNVPALMLLGNALAGLKSLDEAVDVLQRAVGLEPDRTGLYTNLGVLELAQGDRHDAEAAFKRAVTASKGSADAYLGLGNFYRAVEDLPRAEETLKQALALAPQHVEINRALAALFIELGRPAEAEPHLKSVAALSKDVPPRFALADYYVSVGRHPDAIKTLEDLATIPAEHAVARTRIALVEYLRGRRDEAHKIIDAVLAKDSRNGAALTTKARLLLAEQKTQEALDVAKTALEVDPQSITAHLTYARILLARNRVEDARRALNDVLSLDPNSLPALLELVEMHRQRSELDTALGFADQAIRASPASLAARLARVRALIIREQDHSRAEADLRGLLARYPRSPDVHAVRGSLLVRQGNPAAARQSFEKALELNPAFQDALAGVVAIDLAAKRPAQARGRIEAALAKNPDSPGTLTMAGKIYALTGENARAEAVFKRAIAVNPSNPEPYGELAAIYMTQGKLEEAKKEFTDMAKFQPQSAGPPTMLGILHYATRNFGEAQASWERALVIDPQAAAAANNLAWLFAENQTNLDRALELALLAKTKLPDQAEINDTIGWVYYKKKMGRQAAQYLQQSVEKDPSNPVYHYHLGMALAQAGEDPRARRALERALSISKDFPGADEARKTLKTLVY